ncbi:MAG: DUF3467 domain-containing protein [Phycisphaerae bacterium]|jgi:hypothetical protein|nr:DUF3467 domain-containing protein [Phycisphaerae bacterium]
MAKNDKLPAEPDQTEDKSLRIRMDERDVRTSYANGFRTNGTAEEVILDFGLNIVTPTQSKEQPEVIFQINNRVILNYYSAKRLALTLGQLVRRHEERFGELELDHSKRTKDSG